MKTQLAYLKNPDLPECWIFFMTKLFLQTFILFPLFSLFKLQINWFLKVLMHMWMSIFFDNCHSLFIRYDACLHNNCIYCIVFSSKEFGILLLFQVLPLFKRYLPKINFAVSTSCIFVPVSLNFSLHDLNSILPLFFSYV